MKPPVISVRNLRFQYEDGTVALDGVDFDLQPGETVALFGANGSGKTTFVLHLNGLLEGSGSVEVCGMPVRKETLKQVRQKIGLVFQDPDDQLFMPSVLEDVAFGALNLGLSPEQATASMQRDIMAGRPSELESQLGVVVRLADRAGVEVPLHTFLYACLLPQERKARGDASMTPR